MNKTSELIQVFYVEGRPACICCNLGLISKSGTEKAFYGMSSNLFANWLTRKVASETESKIRDVKYAHICIQQSILIPTPIDCFRLVFRIHEISFA